MYCGTKNAIPEDKVEKYFLKKLTDRIKSDYSSMHLDLQMMI